eukprot:174173_1
MKLLFFANNVFYYVMVIITLPIHIVFCFYKIFGYNEAILYSSDRSKYNYNCNGEAALKFHKSQIRQHGAYHMYLEFNAWGPPFIHKYSVNLLRRMRVCSVILCKSKFHVFAEGSFKYDNWLTKFEIPWIIKKYKYIAAKQILFYNADGMKVGEWFRESRHNPWKQSLGHKSQLNLLNIQIEDMNVSPIFDKNCFKRIEEWTSDVVHPSYYYYQSIQYKTKCEITK